MPTYRKFLWRKEQLEEQEAYPLPRFLLHLFDQFLPTEYFERIKKMVLPSQFLHLEAELTTPQSEFLALNVKKSP